MCFNQSETIGARIRGNPAAGTNVNRGTTTGILSAAPLWLTVCALIAPIIVFGFSARSALSQVIKTNESALTPYKATDSAAPQSAIPSAYLYVAVRPGPTGTLSASEAGASDVTVATSASGFAYPSLDFVISAASQLIAEGSSSNNAASASKALAEVSRINAHVRIDSLDASRAPFRAGAAAPPVLVLMIAPEDVAFGQGGSNRAADIATGVEFATRFMGPLGDLVSAFQSSHKNNRAPTQIAYQSSDNEFGWTWYESSDTPIEGIHRCAALLQVPLKAAYLHVAVDLITDWRHFGPWKKSFDFQVPVLPATRKQ
jgi:hypothetical protein